MPAQRVTIETVVSDKFRTGEVPDFTRASAEEALNVDHVKLIGVENVVDPEKPNTVTCRAIWEAAEAPGTEPYIVP